MIPAHHKVFIGAIGALCLSVLKLIGANFYLGITDSSAAWGAYLTYSAYIILGMAVGFFFCEDNPDIHKTRKSAFLMGLLAPSILLAIISKPVGTSREADTAIARDIPILSGAFFNLFVSTAYAQEVPPSNPIKRPFHVQTISKKDVTPGFDDGIKSALGIQRLPQEPVVFVVGKTGDKTTATNIAAQLERFLLKTDEFKNVKIHVLQPESSSQFYVTVGDLASPARAAAINKRVKDVAIAALVNSTEAKDKNAAKLLAEGDLYKGTKLFGPK